MELIWRSAPTAGLRLWSDGPAPRWVANDAALAWALSQGLGAEIWPQLAERAWRRDPADGELAIHALTQARCRVVELPDGLLVWLDLAAEQAQQSGREQAAFMARMSHELRTPLNAVLGFARLLADDPDQRPTPRQAERLQRVREAGSRLLAMIDGVLEIATRPVDAAAAEALPGAAGRPAWLGRGALTVQPDLFEQGAVPANPAKQLRVVCVEDNDVNMLLVRELLALRPEVELHGASDGGSGIETALRVRPDVMLLDLQLPDISGQEVMRRLRAEPTLAECRWVALSANAMAEHIRETLALGFDDYWTKPIDFGQFLAGIDALVLRRLEPRAASRAGR